MSGLWRIAGTIGIMSWGMAAMNSAGGSNGDLQKSMLPEEVRGWQSDGDDHAYDAETIFDYIDGAGEVYRAYNMKALLSRRYKKAGRPDIIADVFDMGSAADAFGVFTHDLDGEDAGVGQGSVYKGGLLSFWKDRYFASIFAEDETEEAKAMLLDLGRRLAASIGREGEKPLLLGALPAAYADPKRVHFFHHPVILNYHFFVSADNVLGLDPTVEGLLVKAADQSALVVVRYPDESRAASAFQAVRAAFLPGASGPEAIQAGGKTWTAAGLQGRTLAVLFRGRTEAAARDAVGETADHIRKLGL